MKSFMFGGFEIIFMIMFFLVITVFIVTAIRGIKTWNKNNHSPRLTVEASVVAKRTNVSHHHNSNNGLGEGMNTSSSSTTYYVTFQVASGDRLELAVGGYDFGMMAEGDKGMLSFQGTRFLGFQRT